MTPQDIKNAVAKAFKRLDSIDEGPITWAFAGAYQPFRTVEEAVDLLGPKTDADGGALLGLVEIADNSEAVAAAYKVIQQALKDYCEVLTTETIRLANERGLLDGSD